MPSFCVVLCCVVAWPGCVPAAHFSREREPKVLLTTCYKPSKGMYAFLAEMLVRQEAVGCSIYIM